jgi:cardiolipin synthase
LFEYQKSVLHAKTTLVDSWVLVGSSNLDYRSLRKDLEINIIPREKKSIRALERQFQQDELQSREVTLTDLKRYPFWTRILSWFFFRFRYWF